MASGGQHFPYTESVCHGLCLLLSRCRFFHLFISPFLSVYHLRVLVVRSPVSRRKYHYHYTSRLYICPSITIAQPSSARMPVNYRFIVRPHHLNNLTPSVTCTIYHIVACRRGEWLFTSQLSLSLHRLGHGECHHRPSENDHFRWRRTHMAVCHENNAVHHTHRRRRWPRSP